MTLAFPNRIEECPFCGNEHDSDDTDLEWVILCKCGHRLYWKYDANLWPVLEVLLEDEDGHAIPGQLPGV